MSSRVNPRRLKLLLIIALVGVLGLGSAYAWRKHRSRVFFADLRVRGLAAAGAGNDLDAIRALEPYLPRHPDDVDALVAYVKCRPNVPADGEETSYTIVALRHLLRIQPDRIPERRQLLGLYLKSRYYAEAADSAKLLLETYHDQDPQTKRGQALALTLLQKYIDAEGAAQEWQKAAPRDLEAIMLNLQLKFLNKKPEIEILKFAKAAFPDPADAARADLVQGYVLLRSKDLDNRAQGMRLLSRAAETGPDDDRVFGSALVAQLDTAGQTELSLLVVRRLYNRSGVREIRFDLARRMWEFGRFDEVVELFAKPKPEDDGMPSYLLAMKVASLRSMGRAKDAQAAIDKLKARSDDAEAKAWAVVIDQLGSGAAATDPLKIISACERAIAQVKQADPNRNERYLRLFIGQAYENLREFEIALHVWGEAMQANPTWSAPFVMTAKVFLEDEGRSGEALEAATAAVVRAPKNRLAVLLYWRAWAQCIQDGLKPGTERALLNQLEAASRSTTRPAAATMQPLDPDPELLILKAIVLGEMKRIPEGTKAIQQALERKSDLSEQFLARLADVSRRYSMGMDSACLQRSKRDHGMTAQLALNLARQEFAAKNPKRGVEILAAARDAAGGEKAPHEWQVSWALYLDLVGDARAKETLIHLADSNPDNITIQRLGLAAKSTRDDDEFRKRAIERMHARSGEQALTWRIEMARGMVQRQYNAIVKNHAPKGPELADAIKLLGELVNRPGAAPADAYALYGTALNLNGQSDEAVEQFRVARDLRPDSISLGLQLAEMYRARGETQKLDEELARLAKADFRTPAERGRTADLLASQGNLSQAIQVLAQQNEDDAQSKVMLARFYSQKRKFEDAEKVLQSVPDKTADVIVLKAELLAASGKEGEAEQQLQQLDDLTFEKPGNRELVKAEYFRRHGKLDRAIEVLLPATSSAPKNPFVWKSLLLYYVSAGDVEKASQILDRGIAAQPEKDDTLPALKRRADLLAAARDAKQLPLLMAFIANPTANAGAVDAIDIFRNPSTQMPLVDQLQSVANEYPRVLPLQLLLAREYLDAAKAAGGSAPGNSSGNSALKESGDNAKTINLVRLAGLTASRAAQIAPDSPSPFQLMTEAALRAGNWTEMLAAAQKWRERATEDPLPADLAVATGYIKLRQWSSARAQLQGYLSDSSKPEYAAAKTVLADADKYEGKGNIADVLRPLLKTGPDGRQQWMKYALDRLPANEAAVWLREAAQVVPADSVTERLMLAQAWSDLANRALEQKSADRQYSQAARSILEPMAAKPDAEPMVVLALANRLDRDDDVRAVGLYRRVATSGDERAALIARNNLAMLLTRTNGDMNEARQLIADAIAKAPAAAALHDTNATVLARVGDTQAAIDSMYKAVKYQPNNLEYRIHLAEILLKAGQRDKAREELAGFDKLVAAQRLLSEDLRQRLDVLRAAVTGPTASAVFSTPKLP
jgi:predicted Zn-dependent protease